MTTRKDTEQQEQRIVKIGVFYDGGFFHHISNYYRYAHPRKQRISIPGLHDFIRQRVAALDGIAPRCAHLVDSPQVLPHAPWAHGHALRRIERVRQWVVLGERERRNARTLCRFRHAAVLCCGYFSIDGKNTGRKKIRSPVVKKAHSLYAGFVFFADG